MEKEKEIEVDFELPAAEPAATGKRRIHIGESTCESCEG